MGQANGVAVGAIGFFANQRLADGGVGINADRGFTRVDVGLAAGSQLQLQHLARCQVPAQQGIDVFVVDTFTACGRNHRCGVGCAVQIRAVCIGLGHIAKEAEGQVLCQGARQVKAAALGVAFVGVFLELAVDRD